MGGLPWLVVLWSVAAVGDRLWFSLDHSVPGWDEGGHLVRAMNYWRLINQAGWFSADWWHSFWTASTKYPPLVYALTAPFINVFGTQFDAATLVNLPFSAMLLLAVYGLGAYLFTVPVGLMAAGICLVMPGLYRIRLDYLIDYPLVALVTLSFFCLTVWWGKAKGKWQFAGRNWAAWSESESEPPAPASRQRDTAPSVAVSAARSAAVPSVLASASTAAAAMPLSENRAPENPAIAHVAPASLSPGTSSRENIASQSFATADISQDLATADISTADISTAEIPTAEIPTADLPTVESTSVEGAKEGAKEEGAKEGANPERSNPEPLRAVPLALSTPVPSPPVPVRLRLRLRPLSPFSWRRLLEQWCWAIAFGLCLGLSLLAKQTTVLFFIFPLLWIGLACLWQLAWGRLLQLLAALAIAAAIVLPWFRASWLLILTAVQGSTTDPALIEGDPGLASLSSWLFYWQVLPKLVSWVWLLPLVGLVFYWKPSSLGRAWLGREGAQSRLGRLAVYQASRRSLLWLLLFVLGGYLLNVLNPNKDLRYIMPLLPTIAVVLAFSWTLLPQRWRIWKQSVPGWLLRWGLIGFSLALTVYHLYPNAVSDNVPLPLQLDYATRRAYTGKEFPLAEIVDEVIKTDPYEKSTLGLLTSTPELNQQNLSYYGQQQNFQVSARDVAKNRDRIDAEIKSLSWFVAQTGGPAPQASEAQVALQQRLVPPAFQLHKTWSMGDRRQFSLYHRTTALVEIKPLPPIPAPPPTAPPLSTVSPSPAVSPSPVAAPSPTTIVQTLAAPVQLTQVTLAESAPPGQPLPITYTWSGPWKSLQLGLVLINWRLDLQTASVPVLAPELPASSVPPAPKKPAFITNWLHDHAIAQGNLQPGLPAWVTAASDFQLTERMAMLPPADATPGTYTLEVLYQNRQTGETMPLAAPAIRLTLDPTAKPVATSLAVDLLTRLRTLATLLPQGIQGFKTLFPQAELMNQYNPGQDYLSQAQQAMAYRLLKEPQNLNFAYTLALANVLKQDAKAAIASFQTVTQLDAKNPFAYAYLAFVNLYALQPDAAQAPLDTALQLNARLPELQALKAVATLLQGDLPKAWQFWQSYQTLARN